MSTNIDPQLNAHGGAVAAEVAIAQGTDHSTDHGHDELGSLRFGFWIFLLSESIIFISFFVSYTIYKTSTVDWLPAGVSGLDTAAPAVNTVVLISSSFVIYVAERFLHDNKLWGFRLFWLLTMAMGVYFLYGQAVEWSELEFGFTDGTFGGIFYLLTGFHGLHVLTGVLLQTLMLGKSFVPGNYETGEFGVEATSLFWHFVDVIWVILFALLYLWQ
ncbi:MAG: heme-copper oxidase subunit III [Synechococcales cyanobacterium RM1_1_8]|nr:heme-copper oxidase subunit III [Synechococcales cyanobacterium RM1_1_8]